MRLTIWGWGPQQGRVGWEHAEATLSWGTSSVTAARSCGTEPGGGTAGQVFHPLPSAHHLGLAILLQGQDMRRPPSDLCQALLCLRKPQFQSLGNGIKSCGNELMLPLFNPLGTASRLEKKKKNYHVCCLICSHVKMGDLQSSDERTIPDWAFVMCPARHCVITVTLHNYWVGSIKLAV